MAVGEIPSSDRDDYLEPERLAEIVLSRLPEGDIAARMAVAALRIQAEQSAMHPVTGLPDRRALGRRHARAIAYGTGSAHERAGGPVAWLTEYVDLDRFKEVNDTLGHGQGDRILQIAGAALGTSIREDDELYHIGGDEFCIFAAVRTPEGRETLAGEIEQRFHERLHAVRDGGSLDTLPQGFQLTPLDREAAGWVGATFGTYISDGPVIDRMAALIPAEAQMRARKSSGDSR